jgi:glucose-6-phosphate 1-dehydrogenase
MSTVVQATPREKPSVPPLPQGDSCVLVIFGASGDLTRRKLIPALFDLNCVGCTNPGFEVLGVGRTRMSTEQFREAMRKAVTEAGNFDEFRWWPFAQRLSYLPGDINDGSFHNTLAKHLDEMRQAGSSPNRLFYLSTPASVAAPIVQALGAAGLHQNEHGWSRIVLEKPFGRDLESARALNRSVLEVFDEQNIYRIDHYLGKETVQNIMVFRFGNSMFEPVWNRNYIDCVEITAAETLGVEGRAGFYEETGALRDMVANHMLQLLTLTAMEPPVAFDADAVREEKVKVLRAIHPMSVEEVAKRTLRGQYGAGTVAGNKVPGYRQERDVKPDSVTETYAAVEFHVDNWRWAGVPFFVRAGKRLARHLTEIRVHFKRTPQALFARTPDERLDPNVVTLRIQPNEGISIAFGAKRPGTEMRPLTVHADFSYAAAFGSKTPAAYSTLLLDAMRGDATLFTRRDEVEAEWSIITPIEEAWSQLPPPEFPNYAAGSDGPAKAEELICGDHRSWHPLEGA